MGEDKRDKNLKMDIPWRPDFTDDWEAPDGIHPTLLQIKDTNKYLLLKVKEYKVPIRVKYHTVKINDFKADYYITIKRFDPYYKEFKETVYSYEEGMKKLHSYTYEYGKRDIFITRDIAKTKSKVCEHSR